MDIIRGSLESSIIILDRSTIGIVIGDFILLINIYMPLDLPLYILKAF